MVASYFFEVSVLIFESFLSILITERAYMRSWNTANDSSTEHCHVVLRVNEGQVRRASNGGGVNVTVNGICVSTNCLPEAHIHSA